MTDAELAEIEARANAATAGPWEIDWYSGTEGEPTGFGGIGAPAGSGGVHAICTTDSNVYGPSLADATFICAARADVPALVAEVRKLRESETALLEALEKVKAALGDRLLAKGPLSLPYAHGVMRAIDAAIAKAEQ